MLKDDTDYRKFKIDIRCSNGKNILISFIQDWIRRKSSDMELQTIGLRIFVYNRTNRVRIFKTEFLELLSLN